MAILSAANSFIGGFLSLLDKEIFFCPIARILDCNDTLAVLNLLSCRILVELFFRDESAAMKPVLPASILEAWSSLAPEVRAALIAAETSSQKTVPTSSSLSSMTSSSSDDSSSNNSDKGENILVEIDAEAGTKTTLRPLDRAPNNVFEIEKTTTHETVSVEKTGSGTITTKKTVTGTTRGWRNIYSLPISYDVNMVPCGTLLDPSNMQLLEATGVQTEGYNQRFAVIDEAVNEIYGDKILNYFKAQDIVLHTVIIKGGEPDKRKDVSIEKSVSILENGDLTIKFAVEKCIFLIFPIFPRFLTSTGRPSTRSSTLCAFTS